MGDYYETLGVPRTANTAAIRKAYFQIARDRHPDRFSDPEQREKAEAFFTDATAAFNTLGNEKTRAEYDASLARPQASTPEERAAEAFSAAVSADKSGDSAQALEMLQTATHFAPDNARYQEALGRHLARDPGAARQAAEALEAAVRLNPKSATAHGALAQLYASRGMKIRARKAAEQALRLAPRDAEIQKIAAAVSGAEGAEANRGGGGSPAPRGRS
jgi:DnaJ-class molecular chaperone